MHNWKSAHTRVKRKENIGNNMRMLNSWNIGIGIRAASPDRDCIFKNWVLSYTYKTALKQSVWWPKKSTFAPILNGTQQAWLNNGHWMTNFQPWFSITTSTDYICSAERLQQKFKVFNALMINILILYRAYLRNVLMPVKVTGGTASGSC